MVGSTIAGALGAVLMKLSHMVMLADTADSADFFTPPEEQQRRRRLSWMYWLLGAVVCNACLNVGLSGAALACAAQSLLSPLVACQIVFNALLSQCVLGERLTRRDVGGTLLIVTGCVLAGVFAPKQEQHYSVDVLLDDFWRPPFLVYLGVMAVCFVGAYLGARAPHALVRRVCAPTLPGLFVGNANVFAKGAAGLVEEGFVKHSASALTHPAAYLLLLLAFVLPLGSLYFLNKALSQLDASKVVPIYISTLIVVSTVSGGLYFGELQQMGSGHAAGLAGGVLLVVGGVCVQAARAEAGGSGGGGAGLDHRAGFGGDSMRLSLAAHGIGAVVDDDVLPLPPSRGSMNSSSTTTSRSCHLYTPGARPDGTLDASPQSGAQQSHHGTRLGGSTPSPSSRYLAATPPHPTHRRACSIEPNSR